MTIQVTGKNIETSPAFQDYVTDKITDVLEKYIGSGIAGHVRIEKERGRFRTSCSIRLKTGLLVEVAGEGADAYQSADAAVAHLDKRVRRYKRRLTDHHAGHGRVAPRSHEARDYVVNLSDEGVGTEGDAPMIIAETQLTLDELPVSEAVLQLDLTDRQFLVFRNAAHGGLNVVYRRSDGHIGWIDPSPGAPSAETRGA